jgi:hypothetical protein
MVKWKQTGFIAAIGIIAFVAGRAIPVSGGVSAAQPEKKADKPAQPEKKADKPAAPGMDDAMAVLMQMGSPGAGHKALEPLIGEFEGTVKFTMGPGMDPMESKATIKREWIMDGRFVIEHVSGDGMGGGPPFKGMGIVGYSNLDKHYESYWIENMATHMSFATGTFDAAKKTFTLVGDMLDPMTGKKVKQTSVLDISNPDREVMTGTAPGPDGKPMKNFEGVFERKKK